MNHLERQIQRKKRSIATKKHKLREQLDKSKKKLVSALAFDASILGGLLLGYFLLPKKWGRFLFKSVTLVSSINQIRHLLENQPVKIPRIKKSLKRISK